ncbi:MAG: ABC transporter permease [Halobacteriales archaeon]
MAPESDALLEDGDPLEGVENTSLGDTLGRNWPAVVFTIGSCALAAGFHYEHVRGTPVPGLGDLEPVDWLLAVALLAGGAMLMSVARRPDSARIYLRRLRNRPTAMVSALVVGVFLLVGLVGPAFVSEPTEIRFSRAYLPPVWTTVDTQHLIGPCLGEVTDGACHGTWAHPFGTDRAGQDLFAFVVLGTRTAVEIALVTTLVMVPVGVGVGLLSGVVGGRVDAALMRLAEVLGTLPAVIVYILFWSWNAKYRLLVLILAFGLVNWGGLARAVRNETLDLREQGFVQAARAAGASRWHVARYHLLPNVGRPVLSTLALQVPLLVAVEAALSFVQLPVTQGVATLGDPSVVSWGQVIYRGVRVDGLVPAWWITVVPTLVLIVTMLSLATFSRSLSDVFAPVEER